MSKEELSNLLQNENVQYFLYNIMEYEADRDGAGNINAGSFNRDSDNSSAFGIGQFTGGTRKDVMKRYDDLDPWSEDPKDQLLSIIALVHMDKHLDYILKGDFDGFSRASGRWQAFYPPEHKHYKEKGNNRDKLIGERPKGWEQKYKNQLDTAVYNPDYSWNINVKDSAKKGKINLYTNPKYHGDTLPDSMRNVITPEIKAEKPLNIAGLEIEDVPIEPSTITSPQIVESEITDPAILGLPTLDDWKAEKEKKENEQKQNKEKEQKEIINNGQTSEEDAEEEIVQEEIRENNLEEDAVEEDTVEEDTVEEDTVEEVEEDGIGVGGELPEVIIEDDKEISAIKPKPIQQIPTETKDDIILPTVEVPELEIKEQELTPLSELSDSDIKNLSSEAKQAYGLKDDIEISGTEVEEVEIEVIDNNGDKKTISYAKPIESNNKEAAPTTVQDMADDGSLFKLDLPGREQFEIAKGGKSVLPGMQAGDTNISEFIKKKEQEQKQERTAGLKPDQKMSNSEFNIENINYVRDVENTMNTNTINLLKEKYPDLDFSKVNSKIDWLTLANSHKKEKPLSEWNQVNSQFSPTGQQLIDYNNAKDGIKLGEGVWDWVTQDPVSGENLEETYGWKGGKGEKIKSRVLDLIDPDMWVELYNQQNTGVGKAAQASSINPGQRNSKKEQILATARTLAMGDELKGLNKVSDDIIAQGHSFDFLYRQFENSVENLSQTKQEVRHDLEILKSKYGAYQVDSGGGIYYKQKVMMSDEDKIKMDELNVSLNDMEGTRKVILADRTGLKATRDEMNLARENYNNQWEELTALYNWNTTDHVLNPAFTATQEYMDWNESIKNNYGKTADVITTFGEEWLRLKLLTKGINPVTLKAVGIATAGTLVADATASLWEDKVYEFPPSEISKYNKGYTHTGVLWDILANIATTDMLPTSHDASGQLIQHSKFTKEDQAKWDADKDKYGSIGGWATELYDKVAPGWAGGKGNWSMYSTSKSFAQLLPYTMNIYNAYKGMGQLSTKVRGTKGLWDARSKMSKKWGTDKGLGKAIVSSLNKKFVASEKMLSRLNMVRVNHKMTFFDNYADGRARGLSSGDAFAYGNFLSLATGLSQMVMPDYNWIKSSGGGKIIGNLVSALKSGEYKVAAKQIDEIARTAGNKAAFQTAGRNFMKEHLEEQLDVALQDVVKASYLANHSLELFSVDMQAEVLSATTTLTVPLGSVSAITTRNNVRSRVYNAFKGQGLDIIRQGEEEVAIIQRRIKKTGNTKKDKILREELIREQTLIEEQIKESRNIVHAINASPKNVTDTQIDLLVRKNKLLKKSIMS